MLGPRFIHTKRYFSRNETKRNDIVFGTENRNEINIVQKRNGTKRKKKRFLTPVRKETEHF
jgi:hypothetical protein